MKRLLLITTSVLLLISACKHDPVLPPDEGTGTGGGPDPMGDPCDPDTVYFQNDVLPLLLSNCAFSGCHAPATTLSGVILDSYQNVMNTAGIVAFDPENSELYEAITDTDPDKRMPPPPNAALSQQQIDLIERWIAQGALNLECNSCDTSVFTFSGAVLPVITNYCTGCHSGTVPSGGLSLVDYTDVVTAVNTTNLVQRVNQESGVSPMPPNGVGLSDCQFTRLDKWIDAGMPDD